MLPSSGYFSHLPCPHYEKGNCQRVYCHFKHKKVEQIVSYVPTPVHLLQKQPKLVQPSGSVYKPTPINRLKQVADKGASKPEPASDNGKAKATKSDSSQEDECVYKKIESKLSSIFESNDESTDEDEIVIANEGRLSDGTLCT